MTQEQRLDILLEALLRERPDRQDIPRPAGPQEKRRLLRALMNVRPPWPLDPAFLEVQDAFLAAEREAKGVVEGDALPAAPADPRLALWQGDITRLRADAIVNAANSRLLGCFVPCHGCIDNAIHSAAGLQLREACRRLMEAQGGCEPCGRAKLTPGYNLPASYVLHTVGPIVQGRVTGRDRAALAACYQSCLESASAHGLHSVAFCCISTGEFHFPNQEAACIAVRTVRQYLDQTHSSIRRVIFNVFKDIDADIYRSLLDAG